jgi:hypothetical protein
MKTCNGTFAMMLWGDEDIAHEKLFIKRMQ